MRVLFVILGYKWKCTFTLINLLIIFTLYIETYQETPGYSRPETLSPFHPEEPRSSQLVDKRNLAIRLAKIDRLTSLIGNLQLQFYYSF